MKKAHDYVHRYRGYWSDGGRCRVRIYREEGSPPVVGCSQLADNDNTSVTNMAEYLVAELVEEHGLPTSLTWVEHYPEHEGEPGEWSLVTFCSWEPEEVCLGGTWRRRIGSPKWSPLGPDEVERIIEDEATVPDRTSQVRRKPF
ncbi:MAG TPA: hypothetical protein VKA51_10465 [Rubrobacteraceae bacterium]|nr:hypothetical protein [Rubrobacteraceae bacterium]